MKIKRIFLSPEVEKDARAGALVEKFQPEKIFQVKDIKEANRILGSEPDPLGAGKQSLYLDYFKGRFFEPCPCTRWYFSCGYWILSPVVGCGYDCSYCILQGYLDAYPIQVYLNLEDLFKELEEFPKERKLRLGTGELADSLELEPELGYAQRLIEFFQQRKNLILEFKTKSDHIQPFLETEPVENLVVSWSVSPAPIDEQEEKGTATISQRIESARILSEKGFWVGFHFDPILLGLGIEPYLELVEEIFQKVKKSQIVWFSLGGLRYPSRLAGIIKERHPQSRILAEELFPGKDGKLRYLRPVRERFFKQLIERIRQHHSRVLIYLCMESRELWERLLGFSAPLIVEELETLPRERRYFKPG